MATSYKWRYVNIYDGIPGKSELVEHQPQARDWPTPGYEVLTDMKHLFVIQWTLGDSLHIYIHESLIA